jgi:hypothetical protein
MGHAILLVWRGDLMFEGLTGQNRLSVPLRDRCRDSRSRDAIERRSGSEFSGSIGHRDLPVVHMPTDTGEADPAFARLATGSLPPGSHCEITI